MIKLPTKKDIESLHHRKAIGALVASGVVLIIILSTYFLRPVSETIQRDATQDALATRQALMNIPNPKTTLTTDQIVSQKKLMSINNPSVRLTPAQIEQQKKLMGI